MLLTWKFNANSAAPCLPSFAHREILAVWMNTPWQRCLFAQGYWFLSGKWLNEFITTLLTITSDKTSRSSRTCATALGIHCRWLPLIASWRVRMVSIWPRALNEPKSVLFYGVLEYHVNILLRVVWWWAYFVMCQAAQAQSMSGVRVWTEFVGFVPSWTSRL